MLFSLLYQGNILQWILRVSLPLPKEIWPWHITQKWCNPTAEHPCLFNLSFKWSKGRVLCYVSLNYPSAIENVLYCISFHPLWLLCKFQIAITFLFSHAFIKQVLFFFFFNNLTYVSNFRCFVTFRFTFNDSICVNDNGCLMLLNISLYDISTFHLNIVVYIFFLLSVACCNALCCIIISLTQNAW